jgi:hypothetical protein
LPDCTWPLCFWQATNPKNIERRTRWFSTSGMIELHRNNGHQVATDPLSEIHRVIQDSERSPIEPRAFGPRSNKSPRLNWEMPAISQGREETSTSIRMKFQTLDFSCWRSRSGFFSKSLSPRSS